MNTRWVLGFCLLVNFVFRLRTVCSCPKRRREVRELFTRCVTFYPKYSECLFWRARPASPFLPVTVSTPASPLSHSIHTLLPLMGTTVWLCYYHPSSRWKTSLGSINKLMLHWWSSNNIIWHKNKRKNSKKHYSTQARTQRTTIQWHHTKLLGVYQYKKGCKVYLELKPPGVQPVHCKLYPVPQVHLEFFKNECSNLCHDDVLAKTTGATEHAYPIPFFIHDHCYTKERWSHSHSLGFRLSPELL